METKLENILKNTSEVVSEEELKELLNEISKGNDKIAYIGFEPSGRIHLGHYLQIKKNDRFAKCRI